MSSKRKEPRAKAAQGKTGVKKKAELEPVDQRLMKGLSHPLRVQILTLINERPWSPRELQKELNEGLSQISYHVKVLRDFELIELVRTEPRRGAVEHFYSPVQRIIVPEGMSAALPKSARLEMLGLEPSRNSVNRTFLPTYDRRAPGAGGVSNRRQRCPCYALGACSMDREGGVPNPPSSHKPL